MTMSDHDVEVVQRLTRLETTMDAIVSEVKETAASVRTLAETASGDRRLVKGFVVALGALWTVAQFVAPLLKPDGQQEVVRILREMQSQEARVKALEMRPTAPGER